MDEVYLAWLQGKLLGVFTKPHLASSSSVVTQGYGVRMEETPWGHAITTRQGIVELRRVPLDPK